jgi:hypothetical protein
MVLAGEHLAAADPADPLERLRQRIRTLEAQAERGSNLDARFEELAARIEQSLAEGLEAMESRLDVLAMAML